MINLSVRFCLLAIGLVENDPKDELTVLFY